MATATLLRHLLKVVLTSSASIALSPRYCTTLTARPRQIIA